VQAVVAQLRGVMDEYEDRVLIGEIYLPVERLVAYYGANLKGAHLPFNFQLINAPWNARGIATLIADYEKALPAGGWPNWVLGNHDNRRIATRINISQARVAAMLLLTLRGTPTLYYGDELGMEDVPIAPDQVQDPYEKNVPGLGLGRDPCRTPMQWDRTPAAGFTRAAKPWLPVADDHQVVNVEVESREPDSMLSLYRKLIALRRSEDALSIGSYAPAAMTGDLVAYIREIGNRRFLIALNLGGNPHAVDFTSDGPHARIVLSTHLDRENEPVTGEINLRADEGVIVALHAP
jgi:alpha-glucosidase